MSPLNDRGERPRRPMGPVRSPLASARETTGELTASKRPGSTMAGEMTVGTLGINLGLNGNHRSRVGTRQLGFPWP